MVDSRLADSPGVRVPDFVLLAPDAQPMAIRFPCVVKPPMLSGSQGVIRADTHEELVRAVDTVRRILDRHPSELRALPEFFQLLLEDYVDGDEVVVEGLMRGDEFELFCVFDKPDPLAGPFFEETIYVTPALKDEAKALSTLEVEERETPIPFDDEERLGLAF